MQNAAIQPIITPRTNVIRLATPMMVIGADRRTLSEASTGIANAVKDHTSAHRDSAKGAADAHTTPANAIAATAM